jgi:DNA-binding transcriptional ArsR family regulator
MLATTLTALAEPNRLRIVELLRSGARPVGDIGERLKLQQPQVSKHLRVLKDAGLVDVEVRAQQRLYGLRGEPLRELNVWLDRFREIWDARFERLDDYLEQMKAARAREKKH